MRHLPFAVRRASSPFGTTALAVSVLATFLVACGGGVESSSGSGTSSGGAAPAPAPSPPPADVVGIFHLSQVDATNLEIRADGTYTWTIEGCDFGGGQCGTWKRGVDGDSIVLDGGPETEWSHDGSFKARVKNLRVTPDGTGNVEVQGIDRDGASFRQTWKGGRACAVCGGNLGPTGQELCDAPLPDVCP